MKKLGFTLIELLVVISLIGILMGILLVSFQGTRKSARDGRRKADLEQIRSALEMCRTDKGSYPVGTSISAITSFCSSYLPSAPPDPLAPTYIYKYSSSDGVTYSLCAYLETGTGNAGCGSCGSGTCNYKVTNP